MSPTANMMRRMPGMCTSAFLGSALTAIGLWNFVSSRRPSPSGVRIIATWDRTSSTGAAVLLHSMFNKERSSASSIVDNDADVVQPKQRRVQGSDFLNMSVRVAAPARRFSASMERLEHDRCW